MNSNQTQEKPIHHKGTRSPLQCAHCLLMWYGTFSRDDWLGNVTLCTACHNAAYNYVFYHQNLQLRQDTLPLIHQALQTWIADANQKPFPRPPEQRFHRSVPAWMRNAIRISKVTPNDERWYLVESLGDTVTSVQTFEHPPTVHR
ncbi:hypothetical protein [Dictyobacter kobayashii]|uniref:Uncharacterized protein n=1 Tax=Dictyobacter kobayashii TaxID=2014872 RepID=A0A402ASF6_9CHLR|nr:hypothetical protein [Dictyobacter kobayashii]GCE22022.1 hypothetical protein KDK_58220 [Dictyobacter kobayashii]